MFQVPGHEARDDTKEVVMEKPVKIEDLVKHYLSKEESDEIEKFYRDIGLGHYIDDPSSQPPYPEPVPGPLFNNYGSQTVNCPLLHKATPFVLG